MKSLIYWLRQRATNNSREIRSSITRRRGHTRPVLEKLDHRIVLSSSRVLAGMYRPITELGNNLAHPSWGVAGADLLRLSPAAYSNGYNSPSLAGDSSIA